MYFIKRFYGVKNVDVQNYWNVCIIICIKVFWYWKLCADLFVCMLHLKIFNHVSNTIVFLAFYLKFYFTFIWYWVSLLLWTTAIHIYYKNLSKMKSCLYRHSFHCKLTEFLLKFQTKNLFHYKYFQVNTVIYCKKVLILSC